MKRNRFIKLTGATKSVNRELEVKTRALAGWNGYTTNLVDQPADSVIGAYHQLWRIEKAFRMSKHRGYYCSARFAFAQRRGCNQDLTAPSGSHPAVNANSAKVKQNLVEVS